jgi:multicomponent Na+:H+ antiporter subunit E
MTSPIRPPGRATWRRGVLPAGLCVALWGVLAGGEPGSWAIGLPVSLICGLLIARVLPAGDVRIDARGVLAFVPFFLRRSLAGGVDVARRALAPTLDVAPYMVQYRLGLPADGPARIVFLNVLSLLPGTLAAGVERDTVQVHVLGGAAAEDGLRELETAVGRMFRPARRSP